MTDDVQRSLGRIEGKLDSILETHKSHSERLSSLEDDRNRAKGAMYVIGVVAGGIGAFITKLTSAMHP